MTQAANQPTPAAAPVSIDVIDGPLPGASTLTPVENAGALVCVEGIVRPLEDGRRIAALDYEAYEPMAGAQLRRLAERVLHRPGLLAVRVEHSRGRVPTGACSFRLRIASRHRPEALRAAEEFIDAMKRDVPIWKTAVFVE
jgi:molybdopterin synthase catalytic subunit